MTTPVTTRSCIYQQFICSLYVLFVLLASDGKAAAGELVHNEIKSNFLGRALEYRAYIPESFDPENGDPAILMLHGYGGSARDWLGGGQAATTLERLIEEGIIPPAMLVMPSAGNSWYVQSPAHGPIDRAILEELLPHSERTYGARPERWSIIGLSMGGYGALRMGLIDPERFRFIAALSPAIFTPGADLGDFQMKLFNTSFGDPFDRQRYDTLNPFHLLDQPDLPPLYLGVGDRDYFNLEIGTLEFFLKARQKGHEADLRVTGDGHTWKFWKEQFEEVLAAMGEYLR
jgi:enterochelin esterase family protein